MAALRSLFVYLFWPNPGNATYASPKIQILFGACFLLILLSFVFRFWRAKMQNPVLKKLSRSWAPISFWFGIAGLVFLVSRVEGVGFLAMRVWWVGWGIAFAFTLGVQLRIFKARYYETVPRAMSADPRERYLPRKKR